MTAEAIGYLVAGAHLAADIFILKKPEIRLGIDQSFDTVFYPEKGRNRTGGIFMDDDLALLFFSAAPHEIPFHIRISRLICAPGLIRNPGLIRALWR